LVESVLRRHQRVSGRAPRPSAAEVLLLRAPSPEHWVPADVAAWTLMMAWDLSAESMRSELTRLRLAERFSKAEIDDFLRCGTRLLRPPADYVDL